MFLQFCHHYDMGVFISIHARFSIQFFFFYFENKKNVCFGNILEMKEGANGKLGGFLVFQLFTIEVAEAKTNVSSTGRELTALYFFIS